MGILSTIGSILPTVGTVLGQLLTGIKMESASSAVPYNFGAGITGGFRRELNGAINICNSSLDDGKYITLSVPKIGQQSGETLLIPRKAEVNVTELFAAAAKCDSSRLMVSGSAMDESVAKTDAAYGNAFHYAAGGSNIPVDGVTKARIGTYLNAVVSEGKVEFTSQKRIYQLNSVNIHGQNDARLAMCNLAPDSDGKRVVVSFPSTLAKGTYIDIDVEVDMGDAESILAEQSKRYEIKMMNEQDAAMMRGLAEAVNRG